MDRHSGRRDGPKKSLTTFYNYPDEKPFIRELPLLSTPPSPYLERLLHPHPTPQRFRDHYYPPISAPIPQPQGNEFYRREHERKIAIAQKKYLKRSEINNYNQKQYTKSVESSNEKRKSPPFSLKSNNKVIKNKEENDGNKSIQTKRKRSISSSPPPPPSSEQYKNKKIKVPLLLTTTTTTTTSNNKTLQKELSKVDYSDYFIPYVQPIKPVHSQPKKVNTILSKESIKKNEILINDTTITTTTTTNVPDDNNNNNHHNNNNEDDIEYVEVFKNGQQEDYQHNDLYHNGFCCSCESTCSEDECYLCGHDSIEEEEEKEEKKKI